MNNNLSFFSSTNEFTEPDRFRLIFKNIPNDIKSICEFVQNLLIHAYWVEMYDCSFDESTKFKEMQLRYVSDILKLAESKSSNHISSPRTPKDRVVSICRDFSLMICAILRVKGIPARLRCGFATYLTPNHFEDHWVCEYWSEKESKWVMVDAQLDSLHREVLKIDFDPCNVPSNKFIFAGKAWKLCREGKANPENFGINDFNGLVFIKGNVIRDVFSIAKTELLAWDTGWGILKEYITPVADETEFAVLDKLAFYSHQSDTSGAKE